MPPIDRSMRILVVDDFESMRKLVVKNLQQMGFTHLFQAANGQEALRMLEGNPAIQMVVTDWNMPVMSGIELLRAIRGNPKLERLPVLMITAEIARHQVQEAADAGVSDFLVKPFTVGALQAKFDKIFSNMSKGKVVGVPGSGVVAESPFTSALFARRPAAAINVNAGRPVITGSAEGADNPVTRKMVRPMADIPPPFANQRTAGTEPLALVITDDLQARMTKQANILVVDDVSDNIDVLVGFLQDEYKVRAAKSGEAALRMLASGQNLPDLILLDVMMPEMDGFEVCRRLKAQPLTAGIPVIFLTAADDARNVVQGLELGAVDYVTKPANPTVLKVRVKTHLTRTKAFQEIQKQYAVLSENARLREEVEHITRHDLKNPIGGIMNFADMLLSDVNLSEDQRDLISTIGDSARLVLNMVNLSLDLAKIEQGTYELQAAPVDLVTIMRRAFSDKSAEISAKKLRVTNTLRGASANGEAAAPGFTVLGDELLCYSMFGNLVKNAVEAAPEGSTIAVVYHTGVDGFGTVEITNSGTVPEAIRDSFFDKFATAGKKGGTGIGTYSARLLCEVQNGCITMQTSDERMETCVSVSLPASDVPEPQPQPSAS